MWWTESVLQDEARVQKMSKRIHTLEEVNINVKLLGEMLSQYDRDRSSDADRELIKVRPWAQHAVFRHEQAKKVRF